jgi:hypothetical protein
LECHYSKPIKLSLLKDRVPIESLQLPYFLRSLTCWIAQGYSSQCSRFKIKPIWIFPEYYGFGPQVLEAYLNDNSPTTSTSNRGHDCFETFSEQLLFLKTITDLGGCEIMNGFQSNASRHYPIECLT